MNILTENELTLRAVERDDLDTLYLLENEMAAAGASVIAQPVSRMMLWKYIENYSADIAADKQLRLMIEVSGKPVGAIDISDYDAVNRRGFIGISIFADCQGKGYGKTALELICMYASDILGMHQLVAIVGCENSISRHLFAGAGFKPSGRLRSWLRRGQKYEDALVFQKLFK